MNIHQKLDESIGVVFPYYTWTFLDVLKTWNVSNWDIFEYGLGYSTSWWRCKAKSIDGVDNQLDWADRFRGRCETEKDRYLQSPSRMYDCIIIDGEPVEWRDLCTEHALRHLKPNGILIIDNYRQASCDCANWTRTDALLQGYPRFIFHQPNHPDWKTAYWIVNPSI